MLGFYSIVLTLYLFIAFVELKPILKKTLHFNLLTSSLRSPCVSVCPTKSHHDLQDKDSFNDFRNKISQKQDMYSFNVFQYNIIKEEKKESFNGFQYYRLQEENREEDFNVEDVFQESTIQQLKNSTQFYVKKVCWFSQFLFGFLHVAVVGNAGGSLGVGENSF
jgi:hypothetical protein